jgi:transcriptional regulator with XRE-family HTH domain
METWDRIKLLITKQGTTQEAVALAIGVSPRTFRGWMSRRIMFNADQAVRIAKVLGTTVEYLVDGDEAMMAPQWMRQNGNLVRQLSSFQGDTAAFVRYLLAALEEHAVAEADPAKGGAAPDEDGPDRTRLGNN